MTDDHDVRRALASYADTTPYLDPHAGLRERIVRRAKVRRATIAGSACLAAVIAGSGIGALSRDNGTTAVVASDPTDGPGTASPSSDTATPTPTDEPGPVGDPGESHTPTPVWSPSHSGAPIVRTAGGPDGLKVKVTFAPGSIETAQNAALRVEAEDDDGSPYVSELSWGDGTSVDIHVMTGVCVMEARGSTLLPPVSTSPSPSPTPRKKYPGTYDQVFENAWRNPGRYTLTVGLMSVSRACADGEESAEDEARTITFDIDVLPGKVASNGPAAPDVYADWEALDDEERSIYVHGGVRDDDGFPSSVVVDWGDGTRTERITPDEECDDGGGKHYPDNGYADGQLDHTYAEPGSYKVTLIAATTGCDGDDRQSGALSLDVEV